MAEMVVDSRGNSRPGSARRAFGARGSARDELSSRVAISILKWIVLAAMVVFILGPLLVVAIWAFADQWTGDSLFPTSWTFRWWPDVWNLSGISAAVTLSLE